VRILLNKIPIQDIVLYNRSLEIDKRCQGFIDNEEQGVYGMAGKLNIRPIYQREFIYKDKQRDSVINSIRNNFPLNVLYWIKNKDGTYEVLDGQQRLISIGQYVSGVFSIEWPGTDKMYFHNLSVEQQNQILNYKLMVYFCEGNDSERLNWFRTINIAGEKLTDQEIKNAIYSGPWISDAKKYFSKNNCPAYKLGGDYLKGSAIRQDYLETVIDWISNGNSEEYMAKHQFDKNANELWEYFNNVIEWVEKIFINGRKENYRREMKGVPFGFLYNKYKNIRYNPIEVENEVSKLMMDEDVERKQGIYSYIFNRDEKELHIRSFSDRQKRETYERQQGICTHCKEYFTIDNMEADHITPWSQGGKTVPENCQMLCKRCNRTKAAK